MKMGGRRKRRATMGRLLGLGVLALDIVDEAAREMGLPRLFPPVRLGRVEVREAFGGIVYVVRSENGLYKIGAASNAARRLQTLQTGSSEHLEMVHVINTPRHERFRLERALHCRFAAQRVRGEWFQLDENDVRFLKGMART